VIKRFGPALALALIILLALPALAAGERPVKVMHALDYFHARQAKDGGFNGSTSASTGDAYATPWVMIAIAAAREQPGAWKVDGHSPFTYMSKLDIETRALASPMPPVYYAQVILAFCSSGKKEFISHAGSKYIDLVSKLEEYQNPTDGHFSNRKLGADASFSATITAWAVLAMDSAGETGTPLTKAVAWLAAAQHADGGWGDDANSAVAPTALAVLALTATGSTASADVPGAIAYIRTQQVDSGGFKPTSAHYTSADSETTGWAIQAAWATHTNPDTWTKNGHTPDSYLRSHAQKNGSFYQATGYPGPSLPITTSQAVIALSGQSPGGMFLPVPYPTSPYLSKFKPVFDSFKPSGGSRYTTRTVTVTATFHDTYHGTGIRPAAVTLTVDGANKTHGSTVNTHSLTHKLTGLSNGQHTVTIKIADYAGNTTSATHKFTVAVPVPPSGGGGGGSGGGGSGGGGNTHPGGGSTPGGGTGGGGGTPTTLPSTPTTTLLPSGIPSSSSVAPSGGSVSGAPVGSGSPFPGSGSPSGSTSGVAAAAGSGQGGGGVGTGVWLGGALAALLPLGALASFLVHKKRMAGLEGASHGRTLPGGGSPWQRFKHWLSGGRGAGSAPAGGA